ncbi:MAG: hypothetical protein IPK07_23725 [Deltaproteobacteria bacterium]|jgi:phosphomevalonate kinase|nr:hypothetical protein [Deltaproteobacteria bacterium]
MTPSTIVARAPGKLMLLGEYAVLEPGCEALVVAVDRFVRVRIEPAAAPVLDCPDLGIVALDGELRDGAIHWRGGDDPALARKLAFVDQTLALVLAAARRRGAEPPPFALTVESELGAGPDKAGLGSSASVATAVAGAALAWCGGAAGSGATGLSSRAIFQVAALAHYLAQGRKGSGADVAAAVTGGVVAYRNPGFDEVLAAGDAVAALAKPWPRLALTPLPWPEGHVVVAGATGAGASTTGLIARVDALHGEAAARYAALREALGALAHDAAAEPSAPGWGRAMEAHQRALERFESACSGGIGIVTPAIERLIAIARARGAPAKISGAGGGDSVIALVPRADAPRLEETWRGAGAAVFTIDGPVAGVTITRE